MKNLTELRKRIAKLEQDATRNFVAFKMPDGAVCQLSNKRLLQVFSEAMPEDGIRGRDYETIMNSVSNNADNRLVELFKSCMTDDHEREDGT